MIKVLFFGPVAERAGTSALELETSLGFTLGGLRERLTTRYPEAFALVSLMAVDGRHERDAQRPLEDGAEVVFMSRFSGG